jgi:Ni/Co efflux regulator RcnB
MKKTIIAAALAAFLGGSILALAAEPAANSAVSSTASASQKVAKKHAKKAHKSGKRHAKKATTPTAGAPASTSPAAK